MQGTQNNTQAGGAINLDALLATRMLKRTAVVLGGRTWNVRTDLTGTEVIRCLAFYNTSDYSGLFTLLVGSDDEVKTLNAALDDRKRAEDLTAEARKRPGNQDAKLKYDPLPYSTDGKAIGQLLIDLPKMHSALATAHIFRTSKALHEFALTDKKIHENFDYEPEGESSAS